MSSGISKSPAQDALYMVAAQCSRSLSSIKPNHLKTMSVWMICLLLNYLSRLSEKSAQPRSGCEGDD